MIITTTTTTTHESKHDSPSFIHVVFNYSFYLQHPFSWAFRKPRQLRCLGDFLMFNAMAYYPCAVILSSEIINQNTHSCGDL